MALGPESSTYHFLTNYWRALQLLIKASVNGGSVFAILGLVTVLTKSSCGRGAGGRR